MSTAMNRLLWWHWLLIGFGASLILFLILYFAVVRPKMIETALVISDATSTESSGGTPEMVASKKLELEKAKKETIRINQDWKIQSAVYMPPIDFKKDPLVTYEGKINNDGVYRVNGRPYGVKDLPTLWGRWVSYWYVTQVRDGIIPITGFPIESFSPDPNDVANLKSISFPQTKPWEVEVVARNFDSAMNHLKRFNRIQHHGMPVVDKVAISGQSPALHVKYTLQMFVIPPTDPPAPDPAISATGGSTAGGPSGGGPGGGMGGSMGPMGSSGGTGGLKTGAL